MSEMAMLRQVMPTCMGSRSDIPPDMEPGEKFIRRLFEVRAEWRSGP
jgi:hypothetical protein